MDIYVVSLYKKGKSIAGFRLVSVNDELQTEIRDEAYDRVFTVAAKGLIKNLKVEGRELKGVNGSLDRYAVYNKSQALVILKELQDDKGNTLGYFCSDAQGQTRKLTEEDVLKFASRFSIANGKLVPDANGKQHLSSIEGSYDKKILKSQVKVEAVKTNVSNLPQSIQELISKLKTDPNFNGSFEEKVVATVEGQGWCSPKQEQILKKALIKWQGPQNTDSKENKQIGITDEVKKVIEECKKCKSYPKSFASKLVFSIEKYKKCSEKQLKALKDELQKLRDKDKKQEKLDDEIVKDANTAKEENSKPEDIVVETVKEEETPIIEESNDEQIVEPTPEELAEAQRKAEAIVANSAKNREKEARKRYSVADEAGKEARKKGLSEKEKRAIDQTIDTVDIFDYSIHKDYTAYIEGFSRDADIPNDIVTPETVVIKNKEYRVVGISEKAFRGEPIVTFKASKNINDIGQNVFEFCNRLVSIDLSEAKHTLIPSRMCKDCNSLRTVLLGRFIKRIHEEAFLNCRNLGPSIDISDEVTEIARFAFAYCRNLVSVKHSAKTVNDSAFRGCDSLSDISFKSFIRIAPHSFRDTGLVNLVIPGTLTSIGNKAFADCLKLKTVDIQEGVLEIGEYCFAKHSVGANLQSGECDIEDIKAPKSLIKIDNGAFHNVLQVTGYTGTQAESRCNIDNIPFNALDSVSLENSTAIRVKSRLLGSNPIETLKNIIETPKEGASNPEFEMQNKKLISATLPDSMLAAMGFDKCIESVEPHIIFKAALSYLQDVANIFKTPLESNILRLQDTFYVNNESIYDDGCNKISKISYEMIDTLESGEFIIALSNNSIIFMCDCNLYTDIQIETDMATDDNLPIKTYLHVGDTIGEESTISGHSGILKPNSSASSYRSRYENIGQKFYAKLNRNGITVQVTRKDRYLYIPCEDIVLSLHNRKGDDTFGEGKIEKDSEAINKMLTYDEFLADIKKIKKNIGGSSKFFSDLARLSKSEVERRVSMAKVIEEEKEAQLFQVSHAFRKLVNQIGGNENPNMLDRDTFEELASSYWMVTKNEDWLRTTGRKSLNKTAEYHIDNCKLTEYKSNQVVKFSNPYMNGKKGAYVYVLTNGNTCLGVYASRYSMHYITEKLYELTNISNDKLDNAPVLMTNAEEFDRVDPDLFYHFYDVLESKNGWSFNDRLKYLGNAQFNISMYKPTGVFYLTTSKISYSSNKTAFYSTIPILPIGNMDRALIVATTTNSSIKNNKRLDSLRTELTALAANLYVVDQVAKYDKKIADEYVAVYNKYVTARSLAIAGESEASKYRGIINDRVVYMLGTVHKGTLQRERASLDYEEDIDLDALAEEMDMGIEEDFDAIDMSDINVDDIGISNVEDVDDDIEIDDTDDEETDIDLDEDEMSFEDFFIMARDMGVNDEQQARAMYINFINSQQ